MQESRTKKTIRNTMYSFAYQILDVLLNFVLRTVFIHTLGKSYLGLSGLFSNILTILSLMDLGIGGAIVFCLYKPLAEHDYGKLHALMNLYKKVYTIIGGLVCIIGLLLTPFLNNIVNLPETIDHIYIIYWISIANTAISYFLAYRRSLLIADQRTDINIKNQIVFRTSRFLLLIIVLLFTNNYIFYLIADVLNTFLSNVHINYLVKKRYKKIDLATPSEITKEEKKQILQYVSSGIFTKFGQTIVNCTDNIIISIFISTVMVGLYSNYSMILNNLDIAVYLVFSGITASIGNFAVEKSNDQAEKLFKKVTFGNYILVLYISVCLVSLLSPFVMIWAGNDYLLSNMAVLVVIINFYISSLHKSIECFMGANGKMYYYNRYRSLIEGVINLVVSLLLVQYTDLGIVGVFLGTTVCFICGRVWMDSFVLYTKWFKMDYSKYVVRYLLQFCLTVIVATVGALITNKLYSIWGVNIITWLISLLLLSLIVCIVVLVMFRKTEEYQYYFSLLRNIIIKRCI